nr:hypothetical protein Iba_chr04bCG17030 [Ipomoea batatas]GME08188.1 hypothetical protein Iba_scaffold7367CG0010 [Ipomoea batatas]
MPADIPTSKASESAESSIWVIVSSSSREAGRLRSIKFPPLIEVEAEQCRGLKLAIVVLAEAVKCDLLCPPKACPDENTLKIKQYATSSSGEVCVCSEIELAGGGDDDVVFCIFIISDDSSPTWILEDFLILLDRLKRGVFGLITCSPLHNSVSLSPS